MSILTAWLHPARFMKLTRLPWILLSLAIALLSIGGLWGLVLSPPDYQQGETVRIMYVHVPGAWLALAIYAFIVATSLLTFIGRNPLAHLMGRAAAPLGLGFTTISLFTGAFWGKPMWGAWWVWDARLTSVLVLWFLYLGYWFIANAFQDREQGQKIAALYAILGGINLPIIKWSVTWWHTLHQPSSFLRAGGVAIHSAFLGPLFTMAGAYGVLFVALWLLRLQTLLFQRKGILSQGKIASAAKVW